MGHRFLYRMHVQISTSMNRIERIICAVVQLTLSHCAVVEVRIFEVRNTDAISRGRDLHLDREIMVVLQSTFVCFYCECANLKAV